MDRLSEKLRTAAGVAARISTKIEVRADAIIAREAAIEAMTEEAFSPHEAILESAEKGLSEVAGKLALLSNGGPPLEPSTPSPDALPPAPEPETAASHQPGS